MAEGTTKTKEFEHEISANLVGVLAEILSNMALHMNRPVCVQTGILHIDPLSQRVCPESGGGLIMSVGCEMSGVRRLHVATVLSQLLEIAPNARRHEFGEDGAPLDLPGGPLKIVDSEAG